MIQADLDVQPLQKRRNTSQSVTVFWLGPLSNLAGHDLPALLEGEHV